MGRAYTFSTIIQAYAQRLDEAVKRYETDHDIVHLLKTCKEMSQSFKSSVDDWRLPENEIKRIKEKLNKKRTNQFESAVKLVQDVMEDMDEEFNVWYEDEDKDRVYHI